MKSSRRIRMLEALADAHEHNRAAQEAITRATRLAILEDDDVPPSNVQREWDKTGPRSPFVLPQQFIPTIPESPAARKAPKDRPSQRATSPKTTYAVTSASAFSLLEQAFAEATTPESKARVKRIALRLLDQELVTENELLMKRFITKDEMAEHKRARK